MLNAFLIVNIVLTLLNMALVAVVIFRLPGDLFTARNIKSLLATKQTEAKIARIDPYHGSSQFWEKESAGETNEAKLGQIERSDYTLAFWDDESLDARKRHEEYAELARKNPEVAKYLDEVFGSRLPTFADK